MSPLNDVYCRLTHIFSFCPAVQGQGHIPGIVVLGAGVVLLIAGHVLVTGLVIDLALLVVEGPGTAPIHVQGPGIETVPRATADLAVAQEVGPHQPGIVLGIVPAPVANPRRKREMIEIIDLVPTTLGTSLEVLHVNVNILLLPRSSKAPLQLMKRCDLGVLHPPKMDTMNEPSFDTYLLHVFRIL